MTTITVSSLDFGFRYLGSRPGQLVVLCSWAKNLGGLGGEPWDGIASHPGGSSNTPGRFMAKETR